MTCELWIIERHNKNANTYIPTATTTTIKRKRYNNSSMNEEQK